jgi:predicted transcriptional regulator of viral defense system
MVRQIVVGRLMSLREALHASGQERFTITDLQRLSGVARVEAAHQLAFRLVREGTLSTLARGLYGFPGDHLGSRGLFARWLEARDGHVSHLWALAVHDPRVKPRDRITLTARGQVGWQVLPWTSVTIYRPVARLRVTSTIHEVPRFGRLPVADPEPTLVEALRAPQRFDGIRTAVRFLRRRRSRWDVPELVDLAVQLRHPGVVARLGYLLAEHGLDGSELARLERHVPASMAALDPTGSRLGRSDRRWRLRLNLDLEAVE